MTLQQDQFRCVGKVIGIKPEVQNFDYFFNGSIIITEYTKLSK